MEMFYDSLWFHKFQFCSTVASHGRLCGSPLEHSAEHAFPRFHSRLCALHVAHAAAAKGHRVDDVTGRISAQPSLAV